MNQKNKSCFLILQQTILVTCFFFLVGDLSAQEDSTEARLHRIYEKYYHSPILDSDWSEMIAGIQEQSYTVLKGDTLWGISEIYFGDGNYWSKLWSVNQNITNPHLILVGDTIVFSTGNFKMAPSISVSKSNNNKSLTISKTQDSYSGESQQNYYSNPPSFFIESPPLDLRLGAPISVIPRPAMEYKSDFFLTNEIFAQEPAVVAQVESIGGDRLVSGESNRVILKTEEDKTLSEGAQLSIVNEDFEELERGFGVRVLSIVKVVKMIAPRMYEAEVLRQFDALYRKAAVLDFIPKYVNMRTEGEPQEKNLKILSKDKQIWSIGDIVFLKMKTFDVNVGDLIKMHNQFDRRIDYYTQNGVLKVVSVSPPYATAVVLHSNSAIDQMSISSPQKSEKDSWF